MECSRQWVRERVEYWWQKLLDKHVHKDVHDDLRWRMPKISFSNKMTVSAGLAFSRITVCGGEIRFSLHFMRDEPQHEFDETIAHEVCHIFTDRYYSKDCKHNRLWKDMMISIDQPPNIYHDYKSVAQRRRPRAKLQCVCGKEYTIGPIQTKRLKNRFSGHKYSCTSCHTNLTPEMIRK